AVGDAWNHAEAKSPAIGYLVAIGALARRGVGGVRARDGLEDEPAIVRGEGEGPQLVERPAQRHGPVSAHPAVRGTQPRETAIARRRENGPPGLRPDGERHQSCRHRGSRPAGRTARPGARVPWVDAGPGKRCGRLTI